MAASEPEDVFDIMADDCARQILALTSQEPMSAQELKAACDASERTIYRRLEQLESLSLLEERIEIDPKGHHRSLYETALKSVLVELQDGAYSVRIEFHEDTADRFARLWGDIRGE